MREFYTPFESDMKAPDADLYLHEMPGGQFTNLLEQARALGLASRWDEVCRMYADVNQLLGDIVKVTPTSKSVGDLALFLVTNNLTADAVLDPSRELAYPESVIDLLAGRMGQTPGGFPPEVQKRILRDIKPVEGRPGESLPPADFQAAAATVEKTARPQAANRQEVVSHLLYPRVFQDYVTHVAQFADISMLPTPFFLYGQQPGEELTIDIEPGKTLIVKLLTVGEPHPDGTRTVFFELNGQPRSVSVADKSLKGGNCPTAEGQSQRSEASRRADAGIGRHGADQNRRQREERSKIAVAGSHENGDHALRRKRWPHRRRAGETGHASRGGRIGSADGVIDRRLFIAQIDFIRTNPGRFLFRNLLAIDSANCYAPPGAVGKNFCGRKPCLRNDVGLVSQSPPYWFAC